MHKVYRPADFTDGLSNVCGISERLQGDWTKGVRKRGGDYLLTQRSIIISEPDDRQYEQLCDETQSTVMYESGAAARVGL